jgi:hypothetical protein
MGPPLPLASDRWGEGSSIEKVSLDDIEYCLPADSDVGDLSGEESDISWATGARISDTTIYIYNFD